MALASKMCFKLMFQLLGQQTLTLATRSWP